MDEKKLLESIGDLIDKKFETMEKSFDKKLGQVRDDMNEKFEEMNQEMRKYNQRLAVFENDTQTTLKLIWQGIGNLKERCPSS